MIEDIDILGVKIRMGYSMQDAVHVVAELVRNKETSYICTTNPEFIIDAQNDSLFREIINEADLSLPDGVGVCLAYIYLSKITKYSRNVIYPIKALVSGLSLVKYFWGDRSVIHTIPGVQLVSELCKYAAQNNLTVGFVGGWPRDRFGKPLAGNYNVAKSVATMLTAQYKGLKVLFADSNIYHKDDNDVISREKINKMLLDEKIDIMFVAFGHPNQEKWIYRNKNFIPAKLYIGVGGSFETLLSSNKKTLRRFADNKTEWLYRLITQPWRFKRILKALVLFPLNVFINSLKHP